MSDSSVTALLQAWKSGEAGAESALMSTLYPMLRELARNQLSSFPGVRTLQPTELVHEAYERLQRQQQVQWEDRGHFYAMAATVIRSILIDHLRQKSSQKRGGDVVRVDLDAQVDRVESAESEPLDWLELDSALQGLAAINADFVRVVEMRVFAGLGAEEIAQVMNSSTATVGRQWRFARAWLAEHLSP
jgi:RNA polymerase sigma factor (TIGR02999 family)